MKQFSTPLTQKTINKIYSSWIDIINFHETGSIINIPKRDQLFRVYQFIEDQITQQKFLKDFHNIQMVLLDPTSQIIDEPRDLEAFLAKHLQSNKKNVLLILDADNILKEKPHLFSYLDSLYMKKRVYSILYFFQKNIAYPHYSQQFSRHSSLFKHISIFPYFSQQDTFHFLQHLKNHLYHVHLTESIDKKILNQCGGYIWFITEAVRYYAKTQDTIHMLDHDEMKMKISIFYNEFDEIEKNVLTKLIKKEPHLNEIEFEVLRYFIMSGLVKKYRNLYKITIPLLETYILEENNRQTHMIIQNNKILLNNVVIDHIFSRREKMFIKYGIKNPGQTISRDQAAFLIWGKDVHEQYTDWALDQFIKRLRTKFLQLGFSHTYVKTIKNKGYIFN